LLPAQPFSPPDNDGVGAAAPLVSVCWEALAEHRPALMRLAVKRCPTFPDAEDAVHDVLLRVACAPAVDRSRVGALLNVSLQRLIIDRHRAETRRRRLLDHPALLPVPEAPPDELVCDQSEAIWLHGQLNTLCPIEQRVLQARADGHSLKAISEAMHMTVKAVESTAGRARRRLRQRAQL
jgi:RNA polymerase sigma factor (sigma-70 family)